MSLENQAGPSQNEIIEQMSSTLATSKEAAKLPNTGHNNLYRIRFYGPRHFDANGESYGDYQETMRSPDHDDALSQGHQVKLEVGKLKFGKTENDGIKSIEASTSVERSDGALTRYYGSYGPHSIHNTFRKTERGSGSIVRYDKEGNEVYRHKVKTPALAKQIAKVAAKGIEQSTRTIVDSERSYTAA